jgi:hypothetical protein
MTKHLKNVFKVSEMSEGGMWEKEIVCHRDDMPVALVPKWHTKRNIVTHNFILRSTIFRPKVPVI